MGRVAAPYAVRGWLKIQPFTETLDSLLDYPRWQLGRDGRWQTYAVREAKLHGQFLLAELDGVAGRDAAEALTGCEIAVDRAELPAAAEGEYYWDELIGLAVVNRQGEALGEVSGLLETGAHDILRVQGERERLIPFVGAIVDSVDLAARRIVVDWGKDY
jgi:16S rRNA processing protein RimM